MELTKLETDSGLEEAGVMVEWEDAQITIRGGQYKPYLRFLEREQLKRGRLIRKKSPQSLAAVREIENEAVARFIWIGNQNLTYRDQEVPETIDIKIEILEKIPDFRAFIMEEMERIENFQAEALAEDATAVKSLDNVEPPIPA